MIRAESPENNTYLLVYRGSWNELPKLFLPKRVQSLRELSASGVCSKLSHLLILVFSDLQTQQHNLLHYLLWIIHLLLTYVFPRKRWCIWKTKCCPQVFIQPYISYSNTPNPVMLQPTQSYLPFKASQSSCYYMKMILKTQSSSVRS